MDATHSASVVMNWQPPWVSYWSGAQGGRLNAGGGSGGVTAVMKPSVGCALFTLAARLPADAIGPFEKTFLETIKKKTLRERKE